MPGLYWECARSNTTSWWIDLPIIFFHRSLTPPLLGDCWLQWIGAQGEHFPGLSRQWAWSELSVHVTADSFAVKSLHCEWPPREARRYEGEKVSGQGKECVTIKFIDICPHHATTQGLWWCWWKSSRHASIKITQINRSKLTWTSLSRNPNFLVCIGWVLQHSALLEVIPLSKVFDLYDLVLCWPEDEMGLWSRQVSTSERGLAARGDLTLCSGDRGLMGYGMPSE